MHRGTSCEATLPAGSITITVFFQSIFFNRFYLISADPLGSPLRLATYSFNHVCFASLCTDFYWIIMGFYFWCPQSFRVIVSDFLCGTPPRLSEPDGSFKFVRLAELDFFFFGRFCLPSFAQRCREKKLIWNSIKFFFFFFSSARSASIL